MLPFRFHLYLLIIIILVNIFVNFEHLYSFNQKHFEINKETIKKSKDILNFLFEKLYSKNENTVSNIMNKFYAEFGKIPNFKGLIFSRIKSPLSVYKKFNSNENYQKSWNSIKDLLGFMIIVDNHKEIDNIALYVENKYSKLKNPNSELLTYDFRFINIRNKNKYEFNIIKNSYQINNGYKTVRINLMYNDYPIEIQIKTKEEYIAHKATHDLIYKNNNILEENIKNNISDAIFPLIEVLSFKLIYQDKLSKENIEACNNDLKLIFRRNINLYNKYKNLVNSALEISAIYIFIFKNENFISLNNTNDPVEKKLIECKILKVIKYISFNNEQILNYNFSINPIVYMNYEEFQLILSKIEDTYLLDSISINTINDIVRSKDLQMIDSLSKCYKKIYIGIYNDEFSKLILGQKTIFSEDDRVKNIESIKNVYHSGVINNLGNLKIKDNNLNISQRKKYKKCYLPGVFDMYHPGHRIYIKKANELCENIVIGLKSLNYSMQFKGKKPIFSEKERKDILLKVKGINDVYITNYDIQPDNNTLYELDKYSPNSAIILGSDWKFCEKILNQIEIIMNKTINNALDIKNLKFDSFCKKSLVSFEQYIYLKQNFPKINLIMIPRENSVHSSTSYRSQILNNINQTNQVEINDGIII